MRSSLRSLLVACLVLLFVNIGATSAPDDDRRARQEATLETDRGRVMAGVILVKLREGAAKTDAGLGVLMQVHQSLGMEKLFPALDTRARKRPTPLQRMYVMEYASGEDPWVVSAAFSHLPGVEYAEPFPVYTLDGRADMAPLPANTPLVFQEAPNDPQIGALTYLTQIRVLDAWNVIKAEDSAEDVVIAIVDGGTDWRHPDLIDNVWTNPGETPDNNIDDDQNGFIDDVHGWNFPQGQGDPTGLSSTPLNAQHGTAVAGVAAAVTNNGGGIASASWNASFMPINVSDTQDEGVPTTFGYGGIVYAADNGADIINASWGGAGAPVQAHQEVIDYAREQGALVISSAGNGGSDNRGDNNDLVPNFPPSYAHVLAVGATFETNDRKTGFSNFGVSVDVFAPGNRIFTTFPDGTYGQIGGTSFSSPLTAAVAALVKAQFPDLTPDELREQIRVTADAMEDENAGSLEGFLGKGRLNAFRAVTETDNPAIRLADFSFTESGGDGFIQSGETVTVSASFTNFLADASNIVFELQTDVSSVTFTNGTASLPFLGKGDTARVEFTFELAEDTPPRQNLVLYTNIRTADYTDRDVFTVLANPPAFVSHDTGEIETSITAEGNIGWVDFDSNGPVFGNGFRFRNREFLFEGGLLIGTGTSRVSDSIRGGDDSTQEEDFVPTADVPLQLVSPGLIAHEEGRVSLDDSGAPLPIGVSILQESFADTTESRNRFIVFKYTIENDTDDTIENLYAGLFFDWDISANGQTDVARYLPDDRMGYVANGDPSFTIAAATKLLNSNAEINFRAIDNPTEIYGGDSGDGFTNAEKWQFLSRGVQTASIDESDASTITSAGPLSIKAGCSVEVGFAVIGAQNLSGMQTSAETAQQFWDTEIQPVRAGNTPPVLTRSLSDTTLAEGETLSFTFAGTDADECDAASFALLDPPDNAAIDSETGAFTFTPGFDQAGAYRLTVLLSDGAVADTARAMVTVLNTNRPPTFTRVLPDTSVIIGGTLTYDFSSEDPDVEALSYSLLDPPANADINPETGAFTFTPQANQAGRVTITALASDGALTDTTRAEITTIIPELLLNANYPNPFTRSTTLTFQIPEAGDVTLRIYDVTGRVVRTLVDRRLEIGPYTVQWDGNTNSGRPAASGMYFGRLVATFNSETSSRDIRMVLVR